MPNGPSLLPEPNRVLHQTKPLAFSIQSPAGELAVHAGAHLQAVGMTVAFMERLAYEHGSQIDYDGPGRVDPPGNTGRTGRR